MRIEYDPWLVEEAVHLLARDDPVRWRDYRARADEAYESGEREAALRDVAARLFRGWGAAPACERALEAVSGVERALVARSQRPDDEGADLYVGDLRTLFLRLDATRFLDLSALERFLRHEARHVADMLDPGFQYEADLGLHGRTRAEQDLVRARYRVLWDYAVDLVEAPVLDEAARRAQVARVFAALSDGQRARLLAAFAKPEARTHPNLLAAARDPWAFLGEPRRQGPVPGQPCPLCGFPTHGWDASPPEAEIRKDHPAWTAEQGACVQCCDLYRAGSKCAVK